MTVDVIEGHCLDVLRTLPAESAHCCVTSPPYFGLRDYGVSGQIGIEKSPGEFVDSLVAVFREVRRVLRDDGTLWLNLGDSYSSTSKGGGGPPGKTLDGAPAEKNGQRFAARKLDMNGIPSKNLLGIPWRVAFALQADGWYLRQDIIWHKPNPMPESVTDRCTKAHEYIFLLSKSARYSFNSLAISEPAGVSTAQVTRNRRSVWTVPSEPFKEAHFATYPPALIEPCILAGCPVDGTVLDPFGGAGTTGLVADRLQRNALLIELNPQYADMARKRIFDDAPLLQGAM